MNISNLLKRIRFPEPGEDRNSRLERIRSVMQQASDQLPSSPDELQGLIKMHTAREPRTQTERARAVIVAMLETIKDASVYHSIDPSSVILTEVHHYPVILVAAVSSSTRRRRQWHTLKWAINKR